MARRSVLFTPGDRREMLEGAAETSADVLVFDLEDGVAPDDKAAARETVVGVLTDEFFEPTAELLVRVNPIRSQNRPLDDQLSAADAATDCRALTPATDQIDGLVLPKAESGADVRRLAGHARRYGLPRRVLALVETAAGVLAADDIADAGATDALAFGAEDLAADLGATGSEQRDANGVFRPSAARERVLTAARAAGVDAIDTLWTDFHDLEGLRADVARAAALGFDGKLAIHPDQIQPIHDGFEPSDERLDWARRVLDARDSSDGRGAFAVDGEMIDAPLLAQAERIVDRAHRRDGAGSTSDSEDDSS